jgi:RHS repeat-associated protein
MAPQFCSSPDTVNSDSGIGAAAGRLFDIFTPCLDEGRRMGRNDGPLGGDFHLALELDMPVRQYADATTVTQTYDKVGRRELLHDLTGRTTYAYDGGGRMTTMIYPGATAGQTVTYEYDKADRRTKMTIPGGTVFTYDYDSAGRISLVINPQGERSTFSYDKDDRRKEVHRANNTKTTYLYDKASRLTTLTHVNAAGTELAKFTYSYDKVGNRKQCNELGGDIVTWTYDGIYQLQREKRNGASAYDITHTYDEVGNRLTMNSSGTITTYAACDAANQLTTSQTGAVVTTYTYDANGNLQLENTAGTLTTHTWDDENRLTQVAKTGMTINVYTFNGDGKRVKIVDSTGTRKLLWDLENILLESDTSDVAQVIYTLEPAGYGNLISQRRSTTTSFFLFDALGSTRKLTSSAAAVTDSYDFKAYGDTNATSGSTVNVFKWVGELGYYLDVDRLAYYLRARPYSPKLARFLAEDPLGFGGGDWNLYRYVGNAPISGTDPEGLRFPQLVRPLPTRPGYRPRLPIGPHDPYRPTPLPLFPPSYTPLPPGFPGGEGPQLLPAPGTPEWEAYASRCWNQFIITNRKKRFKCSIKARNNCPPGCGIFRAEGDDLEETKREAFRMCVEAGCNTPGQTPYSCQCGHPTCHETPNALFDIMTQPPQWFW